MSDHPTDPNPASLFDPMVQRCPFPYYRWLRREAPVYWDAEIACHIISRYETIKAIVLDTETFSNIGMLQAPARSGAAAKVDGIRATTYPTVPMLVANDPPSHSAYRKISNLVMSPRRMKAAIPLIDQMVDSFCCQCSPKAAANSSKRSPARCRKRWR